MINYANGLRMENTGLSTAKDRLDFVDQEQPMEPSEFLKNLENVKNCRDLANVKGSPIKPGRVLRTGFLSNATSKDVKNLLEKLGLKTVIDLRSPREIDDDKHEGSIFESFQSVDWTEDQQRRKWERRSKRSRAKYLVQRAAMELQGKAAAWNYRKKMSEKREKEREETMRAKASQRYFISLMNESLYKKGVISRLGNRQKAAAVMYLAGAVVSTRAYKRARSLVLKKVNEGGLGLLNELLLSKSGKGVCRTLKILATPERLPVAIHCTAGKDRTGFIAMLVLSMLGVEREAIVADYTLSDTAYADLNDKAAMVGALKQEDLDPDIFLCAPSYVCEDTLNLIDAQYGSVEKYLDSIGFDKEWREKLRLALTT